MKKQFRILILLLIVMVIFLSACNASTSTKDASKDSVVIRLQSDPETLNTNKISNHNRSTPPRELVVEALVAMDFDDSSKVVPLLAESWEIDQDGMGATFHLRQDAYFSNGEQMTADDVVYSYVTLTEGGTDAIRYPYIDFKGTTAVDKFTVHLPLKEKNITFVDNLSTVGIYSKKYIESKPNDATVFLENTIGTGRYTIKEWISGDHITLVKNDKYWGTPGAISTIKFRVINEMSVAMMELETGGIDVLYEADYTDVVKIRDNTKSNLKVVQVPDGLVAYLGYNCASKYCSNLKLRQAIACAIDREAIIAGTYNGAGHVPYSIVGELSEGIVKWDKASWPMPYNIEKAKQLLAEAGYANGLELTILADSNDNYRKGFAEQVANMLGQVGIKVNIKLIDSASMQETLQNQTIPYDLYVRRNGGTASAASYPIGIINNIGVVNHQDKAEGYQAMKDLIDKISTTSNKEERIEIWQGLQKRFFDEWLYWYPVQHVDGYVICNKNIENIKKVNFSYNIHEWTITK